MKGKSGLSGSLFAGQLRRVNGEMGGGDNGLVGGKRQRQTRELLRRVVLIFTVYFRTCSQQILLFRPSLWLSPVLAHLIGTGTGTGIEEEASGAFAWTVAAWQARR